MQLSAAFWFLLVLNLRVLCGYKLINSFRNRYSGIRTIPQEAELSSIISEPKVLLRRLNEFDEGFTGPLPPEGNITLEKDTKIVTLIKALSKETTDRPGLKTFVELYLQGMLPGSHSSEMNKLLSLLNSLKLLNCSESDTDYVLATRLFDMMCYSRDVHPTDFEGILSGLVDCGYQISPDSHLRGLYKHFKNESRFMTFARLEHCVDLVTQLGIPSSQYPVQVTSKLLVELFRRMASPFPMYPAPPVADVFRLWCKLDFVISAEFVKSRTLKPLFYILNRNLINRNVVSHIVDRTEVFITDEKQLMTLLTPLTTNVTFFNMILDLPNPHFTIAFHQFSRLKVKWPNLPPSVQERLLSHLTDRLPTMKAPEVVIITSTLLDLQPPFDSLPPDLQSRVHFHISDVFTDDYTPWLPRTTVNMAKMGMNLTLDPPLKALLVNAIRPIFDHRRSLLVLLHTLHDLGLVYSDLTEQLQDAIGDSLIAKRGKMKGVYRRINKLFTEMNFPVGYQVS